MLYISCFDYDLDADDDLGGASLYLKDYFQDVKTGKKSTVNIANVPLVLGGRVLESTMSCEIDVCWKKLAPSKPASGGVTRWLLHCSIAPLKIAIADDTCKFMYQ